MEQANNLMVAMARRCRDLIKASRARDFTLPRALHPTHLLSMCDKIELEAACWPSTKLHRWIGFIQCAMMANQMLDLDGAKAMFDEVKQTFGQIGDDQDLLDHLDPESPFEIELGGES